MKYEAEITETKKVEVELETPAFFYWNYRHINIMEERIIEVNDQICLVHDRSDKYGRFGEVVASVIKEGVKENETEFNAALQSFINRVK